MRTHILSLAGLAVSLPLPLLLLDALSTATSNLLSGASLLSSDPSDWAPSNGTDGLISRPQGATNTTDRPIVSAVDAINKAIETAVGTMAVPADSLIAPFVVPISGITADIIIKRQDPGNHDDDGGAAATVTLTAAPAARVTATATQAASQVASSTSTTSVAEPTPSNVLQNIGAQVVGGLQNLTMALAEPLNKIPADVANQLDDALARLLPPASGLLADWHLRRRRAGDEE